MVLSNWKKQPPEISYKNAVLKISAIIMGKHLCETFRNTYFEEHLSPIYVWLLLMNEVIFWKLAKWLKWLFGNLFLDCIWNHLDSVILQRSSCFQTKASNKSWCICCLDIKALPTLSGEPRFHMFIISGYYTKNKTLVVLGFLIKRCI